VTARPDAATPVKRRRLPTRAEAGAALAAAVLFAIAFPPFPLVLPAFVCLVPVAIVAARAADGGATAGSVARTWLLFGVAGYGLNLYWIAVALSLFTPLAFAGYVASLIWLAPFVAFAGLALYVARRLTGAPLALLLPVIWVTLELTLNYLGDLAFPWLPLGLSLSRFPAAIQIADLSGVRGLSFWIALTNGLLADAWLARRDTRVVTRRLVAVVAAAAFVIGYGAWRMATTVLRPLAPIGVIQPNVSEREKLTRAPERPFMEVLAEGTRQVLRDADPQLVVWPETALPDYLLRNRYWLDSLRALAAIERVPMLVGIPDVVFRTPEDYDYYNAAFLTDSAGRFDAYAPYRKRYLVPIVERVPFLNPEWFSGIDYFGGFGYGEPRAPFELPFGSFGVLICYESIFPQLPRRYRREGADLLVNITNDAWFGRTTAPYQHHAHVALRAVETRVGVIRSANTGISGYVDPLGRVRARTALEVPAAESYVAETTDVITPFVRFGDWLGGLCAIATATMVAIAAYRRRRPA
jgi:apolipoprotein N-acyltransferase